MGKDLLEIAQQLNDSEKKVQLIYAFNGTGKTRLSREFKNLVAPKDYESDEAQDFTRTKILYYNAFTEDLFYWDNDLELDAEPKLRIQPNSFTRWVLEEQGLDGEIIHNFQSLTSSKANPIFDFIKNSITFTVPETSFLVDESGARVVDESDAPLVSVDNVSIKISKGEESNFIWSVFYSLLDRVVSDLDESDPGDNSGKDFDQLEYIFVDDPVSSLDDSHLIDLAVNLAKLIKLSKSDLKFIITTHNPLFYNVMFHEFERTQCAKDARSGENKVTFRPKDSLSYKLKKNSDGTFELDDKVNDRPFSYHLFLLSELKGAVSSNQLSKYHFNYLRNVLEKTSTFLGYNDWKDLLPVTGEGSPDPVANRIINLSSHSRHAADEIAELEESDKEKLAELVEFIIKKYSYKLEEKNHA